jgi:hypothetical protein
MRTHIKVGKTCKYLYRAVDKEGNTVEFMLSAKRDENGSLPPAWEKVSLDSILS